MERRRWRLFCFMERRTLIPVILSGGTGSRLWPLSRALYPKQFHTLLDSELSLVQMTAQRAARLPHATAPVVITNQDHRFLMAEQLRAIGVMPSAMILEPEGKNTAPAVAIACMVAQKMADDPIVLIMPADHVIEDEAAFQRAVAHAVDAAEKNHLVTFGCKPTHPETGYGYVQSGKSLADDTFTVAQFVEKPAREQAEQYIAAGNFHWNNGMFVLRVQSTLDTYQHLEPAMLAHCQAALAQGRDTEDFFYLDKTHFNKIDGNSIDYAIMEKADNVAVVLLDAGWSDIGSWGSLWAQREANENGNVLDGDVIAHDTSNSLLMSKEKLLATVGVKDLAIVVTDDVVLVSDRARDQEVKHIVNALKAKQRDEINAHCKVYRPWGYYETLIEGPAYKVKRITVNPGAKLSLQSHTQRAEHWVVVHGVATIVRGDDELVLRENESTYISQHMKHRLSNFGDKPLEVIEVQTGEYLGEDDIVRYEDGYRRIAEHA